MQVILWGFKPFKLQSDLEVDLLEFVDDTLILGQATWENIWAIKPVLYSFDLGYGLRVSFHKEKYLVLTLKLISRWMPLNFYHA